MLGEKERGEDVETSEKKTIKSHTSTRFYTHTRCAHPSLTMIHATTDEHTNTHRA